MTTATDELKQRMRTQYDAAAAAWERRFDWYAEAFGPMCEWLCTAAALQDGVRVLDLACGSGLPSLEAARRVGPAGRVVAGDISPEMVVATRRKAAALGLGNIDVHELDAEHLPFESGSFDAVTCSHGLMFIPDAIGALREMRRVLKPGGRAAVTAWDVPQKSSFVTLAGQAVGKYFPPTPPEPGKPHVFRFSAPGVLERALRDAGFKDCAVQSIPMPIDFDSADAYFGMFVEMAAGIKQKIDALSPADQAGLRRALEEGAKSLAHGNGIRVIATPLGGTGIA
ncbi:MAG TPA: methyltransferase domain-containing protein [Vicinamibacterales bacterium]|nr:methyltransferase domain-containing protein [Vicinamibacterales bacterium]